MSRSTVRQSKSVVSDDVYRGSLATIIQRDFYPDVPYLKHELEADDNLPVVAAIVTPIPSQRSHHDYLPSVIEVSCDAEDQCLMQQNPSTDESLTKFFAHNTSEANVKFDDQQNKESKEREKKIFWLENSKKKIIDSYIPSRDGEKVRSESEKPTRPENAVFFVPKGIHPPSCNDKSDHEDSLLQSATLSEDAEVMPPPLPRTQVKIIQTLATRFPVNSRAEPIHRQMHLEGENSSISGSDCPSYMDMSNASTNLDSIPLPLHIELEQGRQRKIKQRRIKPRVGAVPDTSYHPQSQNVASTKISDYIATTAVSYQVLDESVREKAIRKRRNNPAKTKSPSTDVINTKSLSYIETNALAKLNPSARALWMQTKKESNRGGASFRVALRSSYNGSDSTVRKRATTRK